MNSEFSSINTRAIYPREVFLRVMGWSKHAWRTAKSRGLVAIYAGGRCYVRGDDVARYLAGLHNLSRPIAEAHAEIVKTIENIVAGHESDSSLICVMEPLARSLYHGLSLDEFESEVGTLLKQLVDLSRRIERRVNGLEITASLGAFDHAGK